MLLCSPKWIIWNGSSLFVCLSLCLGTYVKCFTWTTHDWLTPRNLYTAPRLRASPAPSNLLLLHWSLSPFSIPWWVASIENDGPYYASCALFSLWFARPRIKAPRHSFIFFYFFWPSKSAILMRKKLSSFCWSIPDFMFVAHESFFFFFFGTIAHVFTQPKLYLPLK